MPSRDFWSPCGWTGAISFRADKGWAMKRARPGKKVRCGLGSNYGLGKRRLVSQLGISGKWVTSLNGFVNRLPHDCHKDNERDRRYKEFEIYVEISTGTTISQEMLKQTVNKNNIHVPVGVFQVSQLVVMILLINDCYVMSLVVIISRMNFVLYRNSFDRVLQVFISFPSL